MSADAPIVSRPFHPKMACPACCFGEAQHAEWCYRYVDLEELGRSLDQDDHIDADPKE